MAAGSKVEQMRVQVGKYYAKEAKANTLIASMQSEVC